MDPKPLRFPGHGATCQADHEYGSDYGKCNAPAYTIVHYQGQDRVVCRHCYEHLPKEVTNGTKGKDSST
jgi:hypothetical protein